jgi:hypothetical protein
MITEYFDQLTARGIQVIPLWENSKRPMCKGWSKNWDHGKSRRVLQVYPDSNIGILLGDIVDVEGDTVEANRKITNIIKDYPHQCYKSQRSIHHLFLNPDPDLRILKSNNMEFRGHGHQSVLPPSQHQGARYSWVNSMFPIPRMPDELLKFYKELKENKKPKTIRPGHNRIWCSNCQKENMLHSKRMKLELEAFRLLGTKWECQSCRILDIRSVCRRLKRQRIK